MEHLEAVQTITQKVKLTLRKLPNDHSYEYALVSPTGETVGWLYNCIDGVFSKRMIDNSFKIFGTVFRNDNDQFEIG
jgi:hypothetical protein